MKKARNKGITLVALVVTIILLLILAGITISQLTGSGLFENAKLAEQKSKEAQQEEQGILADYENRIRQYVNGNRESGIKDFSISIPYIGTSSVTIKVDTNTIKDTIRKYIYVVGEEVLETTEADVTIENLPFDSNLDVTVIAVTETYKHLISTGEKIQTEQRTYLYNNGDQCTDLTGGWITDAIGYGSASVTLVKPTLTFNENNMNVYLNSSSELQGGSIRINNEIDYSRYTKLCINYTASLGTYSSASIVVLCKNKETQVETDRIANLCYSNAITSKTTQIIDISGYKDFNDFYICVQSHKLNGASNCNIYEVWLEK